MNGNLLILDREHYLLIYNKHLPQVKSDDLERITNHFQGRGLTLGPPIGVRPPKYAFLSLERPNLGVGWEWIPMKLAPAVLKNSFYWKMYIDLVLGGYSPPTKEIDVFSFGNNPFMAARLAHLVIKGKKRATSANPQALKKRGLTIPSKGLVSIVTDGFGIPLCCIQTKKVEFRKYKDVPDEVAKGEGEGDLSLDDWRRGHWEYFTQEAKKLRSTFSKDTEVFTEWFRVLKVFDGRK